MKTFRTWVEEIEEIGPYIKVHLPKVKQTKEFSCGAAALRAVCELFKVGPESEKEFIKALRELKAEQKLQLEQDINQVKTSKPILRSSNLFID